MNAIEKIIDEYLLELFSIRQYSSKTIEAYKSDLTEFYNYFNNSSLSELDEIDEKIIRRYLVKLSSEKLSRASISRKLSSLRGFIAYLIRNNLISQNPMFAIENPKIKRNIPEVLPLDSFLEIIKLSKEKQNKNKNLEIRAIFEILYSSAIRVSELCSLNIGDIDFQRRSLRVFGKGAKERIIPLGEISIPILQEYYEERKKIITDENALFLNLKGKRINTRYIQRLVKKYISLVSDIKKKSPHVLRHSAATHMLDRGADLLTVKEILGHENLSTTQIYTHVSIEHLKNSYKKAHPKS